MCNGMVRMRTGGGREVVNLGLGEIEAEESKDDLRFSDRV